ncbi:trans-sialidase [Trypanosoma brucei equiperdum]|uniref:Trans-sialidase n=1 Tax=Trypanosoma brucei equiperdum TaxID=630700 RepID=A0A3L6L8X3_9TRYP|nr:trans-sialidase [Trypanosoma brucei equiperdum]
MRVWMKDDFPTREKSYKRMHTPLLLLVASVLLLPVCSNGSSSQPAGVEKRRVELFKPWNRESLLSHSDSSHDVKHGLFEGNSLVAVGGSVVALAEARYNAWTAGYAGMWLKTIALGETHQSAQAAGWMSEKKWKTENVFVNEPVADHRYAQYGPRAIVLKDKIFLLSLSSNKAKDVEPQEGAFDLEVKLFVGAIGGRGAEDGKVVKWNKPSSLTDTFKRPLLEHSWKEFFESGGKGAVVGDTILFPLVTSAESGAKTCIIARYKHESESWSFTPAKLDIDDCTEPSLLVWKKELLLVVAHQTKNKMYRSVDVGMTWTDATEGERHALSNFQYHSDDDDRGDFVNMKVDGSDVILFAYRAFFNSGNAGLRPLLLWVTDSKRTHCLGAISSGHLSILSFSALLYTESGVYSLHEEGFSQLKSIFFTDLTDRVHELKAVVGLWRKVDGSVMALYGTTGEESTSAPKFDPTVGLVGFWSEVANRTHWRDGYLGMDGALQGPVKRVTTGFTLGTRAAHVVFPVSGKNENKVYHLIDNGLTVVMSVAVHKAPKNPTPLLGVGVRNKSGLIADVGIWYDEKAWAQLSGTTAGAKTLALEEGKTYQVVLTVRGGVAHTYIDGNRVGDGRGSIVPLSQSAEIHEIYVGANERVIGKGEATGDLSVTVFNMLLYSHELSVADVKALLAVKHRSTFDAVLEDEDEDNGDHGDGQGGKSGGRNLAWIAAVVVPALLIVLGLVGFFVLRQRRAAQNAAMRPGAGLPQMPAGYNPYTVDITDDTLDVRK